MATIYVHILDAGVDSTFSLVRYDEVNAPFCGIGILVLSFFKILFAFLW